MSDETLSRWSKTHPWAISIYAGNVIHHQLCQAMSRQYFHGLLKCCQCCPRLKVDFWFNGKKWIHSRWRTLSVSLTYWCLLIAYSWHSPKITKVSETLHTCWNIILKRFIVSVTRRRDIKMPLSVGPCAEKFTVVKPMDPRKSAIFLF